MSGSLNSLLVEGNADRVKQISQTMAAHGLSLPNHVRTGEEAVVWVSVQECDICVVDYTLRGIDGLETLLHLHQRKPDLPVIMLSSVKSEQVAVAAFRGGVHDYVAMGPGYTEALVEILLRLTKTLSLGVRQPTLTVPTTPSQAPLRVTYENRLRAIGRQLDIYGYKAINVSEVAGGFLVRALPRNGRSAEALEFPDHDAGHVLARAFDARGQGERSRSAADLLPTGYEDFLRALGHRLDVGGREAVTITELEPLIAVGGIAPLDQSGTFTPGPFYELLQLEHIKFILDEAFGRRANQRATTRATFERLMER
ncbi:MAG TPA: response regulator [Chloroflexota bacterium]|nr:response regulator [Chloroflexota bacterium]